MDQPTHNFPAYEGFHAAIPELPQPEEEEARGPFEELYRQRVIPYGILQAAERVGMHGMPYEARMGYLAIAPKVARLMRGSKFVTVVAFPFLVKVGEHCAFISGMQRVDSYLGRIFVAFAIPCFALSYSILRLIPRKEF